MATVDDSCEKPHHFPQQGYTTVITLNLRTEGNRVQVHNDSGRRRVSGSSTGGYAKIHLSTGTVESCNYSRMGRPILGSSEDASPTCGTPANPIMIPSSLQTGIRACEKADVVCGCSMNKSCTFTTQHKSSVGE